MAVNSYRTSNSLNKQLESIREKYRVERDKRIRKEGKAQFHATDGKFAHFARDIYANKNFSRAPINEDVEVAVVGAGFGGLLAAARLKQQGIRDVRLVDQAADVGGTWYWNRFPGARCDIESYIYLPMLEELGYMPTEKYVTGKEIFAYCQKIAREYQLYDGAIFQTKADSMAWDESLHRWLLHTDRGDCLRARYVCMSNGLMHRPKLPAIPGLEDFQGHCFHTSRWDYDYTGGAPGQPMTALANKRVALVGTGATGIQCVPPLAEDSEHLFVIQRTPSSIGFRGNAPTSESWVDSLEEGWHQKRIDNFNELMCGLPVQENMVNDGWTIPMTAFMDKMAQHLDKGVHAALDEETIGELMEESDLAVMQDIRDRVDTEVDDPETAEQLKPWYRPICKRPCFHDEYLATFNRDNVTLVDTNGNGLEKVLPNAVVAGGKTWEVDCIVFATGFEVMEGFARRSQCEIYGVDDQTLAGKWDDGVATLYGMHSRGFPNLFVLGNLQSTFTFNYTHSIDQQARHIAYTVAECQRRDVSRLDVSAEAESQWVEKVLSQIGNRRALLEECTPGYYNQEGQPSSGHDQDTAIMNATEFFAVLSDWREEGELKGFELASL